MEVLCKIARAGILIGGLMEEAEGRIRRGSRGGKTNGMQASVVGSRDSRALVFGLAVPRCCKLALYNTLTPFNDHLLLRQLVLFLGPSRSAHSCLLSLRPLILLKSISITSEVPDTQKSQIKLAIHPACLLYSTLRARPLPPHKEYHTRATISVALH